MSKPVAAILATSALVLGGSVMNRISTLDTSQETKNTEALDDDDATLIQPIKTAEPAPKKPESRCHASYSGCLKPDSGDYDCAGGTGNGPNYTGPVEVLGPDVFDLDRDNDGWGCE